MIKILLVDDCSYVRRGLRLLLSCEDDFEVIGEAIHGKQALELVDQLLPDIVLMDLRMPIMDGTIATQEITKNYSQTKVIVLTTFNDDDLIIKAIRAGAMGYLLKDTAEEELFEIIRRVKNGYSVFHESIIEPVRDDLIINETDVPFDDIKDLTTREIEILLYLGQGKSYTKMAKDFYVSIETIRNYTHSLRTRFKLSTIELAIFGYKSSRLLSKILKIRKLEKTKK